MTNKQIFELMEKHFHLCPIHDSAYIEYVGKESDFLKFAQAIYSEGFSDGCKEGSYSDYTWMRP
jgi:hypothetical protein